METDQEIIKKAQEYAKNKLEKLLKPMKGNKDAELAFLKNYLEMIFIITYYSEVN